ncbi:MAG: chorismate mutase [Candidatus Natronoplasma sp.]
MERIHELRERIDEIDEKILKLLDKRAAVAKEIGEIKKEKDISITDTEREKEVLGRAERYREVFEEIINACKEVQ